VQHIEMARDLAQRFNHQYGREFFVLPEALIEEQVATLPGLDGRKMSKSYDNTIPLFAGGAKATREAVMRIVTDSRLPGEPKDAEASALFTIYRAFADEAETAAFRQALHDGLGWGDAKQALVARIEVDLAPLRERYATFMADPGAIEDILQRGAQRARAVATPKIAALREALGLRAGITHKTPAQPVAPRRSRKLPRVVSFRDADGRFRFRLFSAQGDELLLSVGFADPKAAGAVQQRLHTAGNGATVAPTSTLGLTLELDGKLVGSAPDFPDAASRDQALVALRSALEDLAAGD
jgi:tryptophanyl-tRNA synthetase